MLLDTCTQLCYVCRTVSVVHWLARDSWCWQAPSRTRCATRTSPRVRAFRTAVAGVAFAAIQCAPFGNRKQEEGRQRSAVNARHGVKRRRTATAPEARCRPGAFACSVKHGDVLSNSTRDHCRGGRCRRGARARAGVGYSVSHSGPSIAEADSCGLKVHSLGFQPTVYCFDVTPNRNGTLSR